MKIKLIITSDDPTTVRNIRNDLIKKSEARINDNVYYIRENNLKVNYIHVIIPELSSDVDGNYDRNKRTKIVEFIINN